jgi:hypothetical protein
LGFGQVKKKRKATDRRGGSKGPPLPPKAPPELLADAFVLGLTGQTDQEIDQAIALAEQVAPFCSEVEIQAAKRDALRRVRKLKGIDVCMN